MANSIAQAVVFYCDQLRADTDETVAKLASYDIAQEGSDITAAEWDTIVNAINDLRQSDDIHMVGELTYPPDK